jgi:hypothetical protein
MNMIAEIEANGIPEEQEQRFTIETKDQAIWAMKKISQAKAAQAENKEAAQAEIDRINEWMNKENEKLGSGIFFFESLLREYFFKIQEADPKLKTIKLPHGKLLLRAQQSEYTYDEAKLIPWAKDNLPEAVQIKEQLLKGPIKTYVKETGEIIDGLTIEARPDKFSVEVTE